MLWFKLPDGETRIEASSDRCSSDKIAGQWELGLCVSLCVFLFVFFFHLLVFQSLFKFTSLNKIATTAFKELKSAHVFNKLIMHRAEVQSY